MQAGRHRDQAPEEREHPAEEDCLGAVPAEPCLGALEVALVHQRQPLPHREDPLATPGGAQDVEDEGADHRAGRGPHDGRGEREAAATGGEAGQRQDDLARQRREDVLQRDQQAGAEPAQPVHHVDHPPGDAGELVGVVGSSRVRQDGEGHGHGVPRWSAYQPRTASSSALVSTDRTSSPTSSSGFVALRAPVDRADHHLDHGPGLPQRPRRVAYGAAGGDHVLDQGDPATGHVGALGELAGAVLLGLLAHEQRRMTGQAADHRGDRDAAELQAAEQLGVARQQLRPWPGPRGPAGWGRPRRGTCRSTPRPTCPDRSVNSPVRRQQPSMSRARSGRGCRSRRNATVACMLAPTPAGDTADHLLRRCPPWPSAPVRSTWARDSPTSTGRRR